MAATVQTTSLCDFCHQKPKFNGHPYCGKTCASQAAATLCAQCHQKPKFGNHDFCGKSCAQAASANNKGAGRGSGKTQKPQHAQAPQHAPHQPQAPPPQRAPVAPRAPARGGPAQPPARGTYQNTQRGAPFPHAVNPAPAAPNVNVLAVYGSSPPPPGAAPNARAAPPPPAEQCLIPGCTELAHVDANGVQTSDYCSQRHREEAVNTGLAPVCIMCQGMPQGRVDHFCSRECREKALQK